MIIGTPDNQSDFPRARKLSVPMSARQKNQRKKSKPPPDTRVVRR